MMYAAAAEQEQEQENERSEKQRMLKVLEEQEARLAKEVEALRLRVASKSVSKPCLPARSDASTAVEIASMMQQMPTEALASMLGRLRKEAATPTEATSLSSRAPDATSLPSSLTLASGEATALVDIMAMMKDMPTPALAELLASLQGRPNAASPRLELEEHTGSKLGSKLGSELAAAPPVAKAATRRPVPSAAALRSGRAQLLRAILVNFFTKHQPNALHTVDKLVQLVVVENAMSESELFAQLEARYDARVDIDPHSFE